MATAMAMAMPVAMAMTATNEVSEVLWVHVGPYGWGARLLAHLRASAASLTESPWCATIAVATVALRFGITFPLAVVQHRRAQRLRHVQKLRQAWRATLSAQLAAYQRRAAPSSSTVDAGLQERPAWQRWLQGARVALGRPPAHASPSGHAVSRLPRSARDVDEQLAAHSARLYSEYGCAPAQTFVLPWLQIPLFMAMSWTLRRMSGRMLADPSAEAYLAPIAGWVDGGCLWFTNLAVPDPTLLLPLLIGITQVLTLRWGGRVLAVLSMVLATQVPAALALFWWTSGCVGFLQNVALAWWFPVPPQALPMPSSSTAARSLAAPAAAAPLHPKRSIEPRSN
ncbi:hypothetical protein CXG81DRAFT_25545 [Caulochytrium protostelioides]|uniref:Membrane insertase YidC/Oxa/ALB C-terminal domain-containing protein n=1 Tax=Caulochytrium protostelioides TaxID=1555241 RepID=A0A4P9X8X9_9FUNG|nr:hypothetical protein CXG81DRAFT_25545 [Caulochytrium protostelioides]|eukprot:RKP01774.1 hypothetical protein CXG81DRAFT_25545 [Caulochytrium protostelioides]